MKGSRRNTTSQEESSSSRGNERARNEGSDERSRHHEAGNLGSPEHEDNSDRIHRYGLANTAETWRPRRESGSSNRQKTTSILPARHDPGAAYRNTRHRDPNSPRRSRTHQRGDSSSSVEYVPREDDAVNIRRRRYISTGPKNVGVRRRASQDLPIGTTAANERYEEKAGPSSDHAARQQKRTSRKTMRRVDNHKDEDKHNAVWFQKHRLGHKDVDYDADYESNADEDGNIQEPGVCKKWSRKRDQSPDRDGGGHHGNNDGYTNRIMNEN